MPGEIISGAAPTRMQLIALRKRHRIAERGGDLLREKLDALMIEFFQFAREISALRQRTQDILAQTYRRFAEAEMLMGFERLAEAIAGTKRRVNSLEYIVIPRIENTIRYIEMSLQEREREDFFRLKRIKKRLEQEEAMQPVAPLLTA